MAISPQVNPVQYLSSNAPIVHCCDAGFDMDDYGAIQLGIDSGRLKAVLTSLYRPDQKKAAVEAFVKLYQETQTGTNSASSRIRQLSPRIFAGYGYYPNPNASPEENSARFFALYPHWPAKVFGDPIVPSTDPNYRCIYPYQLQPFIDNGVVLNPQSGHEELEEFMKFLGGLKEPIVYVSTGPTTNLAQMLRQAPDMLKAKIKVIVMMNGTFANPPRMGYNGGLNLQDTQTVLDSGIPCIVVSSALCASYVFPQACVQKLTENRKDLSQFGKLFHDIMLSWEVHRARKKNPEIGPSKLSLAAPILADPLTMFLALHPEFIGNVRRVKYTFDLTSDKHLLHPEAASMVKVEDDPKGTVFEVTSITDPEAVQQMLVQKISTGLTPASTMNSAMRRLAQITQTFSPLFPQTMSWMIKQTLPIFQMRSGTFLTKTLQYLYNEKGLSHFYGIHRDEQFAGQEIKSHLLMKMGLSLDTPFIEVVGDSAAFSSEGTGEALRFLDQNLPSSAVWIYGYTGHDKEDGTKCANAVVSHLAGKRDHLKKTVGNLVGFHSPAALLEWGCSGPKLDHYILVYGNDESTRQTGTVFGDDITTSDFLSDKLIMLEGGIQSFRQACNFLLRKCPVIAIGELRSDKARFAIMDDGQRKHYISAPEFLQFMKNKVQHWFHETSEGRPNDCIPDQILNAWYDEYLSDHLICDPARKDYDTKQKLLDDAWQLFKTEKLYMQLHLFRYGNSHLHNKLHDEKRN